jgi:hypothetical protein
MKLISHLTAAALGALGALLGILALDGLLEARRRKGWH